MNKERLIDYGVDYDKGLKNCMSSLEFYKKILSMFLEDKSFPRAKVAYKNGDKKELFSCMHELKGVCGNAALTKLYGICVPLVEVLRNDDGDEEEINRLFSQAEKAYEEACCGIGEFLSED